MLELKNTPGFSGDNLVMTHPQDKQVGQHSDAHGFLTAVFFPPALVVPPTKARFQLPVHQRDRPAFLVDAHDLSWRQFGQTRYRRVVYQARDPRRVSGGVVYTGRLWSDYASLLLGQGI